MNLANITKFNCNRVKRRLDIEVKKLGVPITIYRKVYEPDGMNGFIEKETKQITDSKLMIFIKSASAKEVIVEGGRKISVVGNLIIPYEKNIEIKKGDYFEYQERKYFVEDCVDVDGLNVYFYINLVGDLTELNGYG